MSHFTLLVTKVNKESIDSQLSTFSEDYSVEPFIVRTKSEVIESERKNLQAEWEQYEAYKNDPNSDEFFYSPERLEYLRNKFSPKRQWTDEEIYNEYAQSFEPDDTIWLDDDGNLLATYNSDGKYDWYVVGGRWTGYFAVKPDGYGILGMPGVFNNEPLDNHADIVKVKDIDWDRMDLDVIERRNFYFDNNMIDNNGNITKEDYINRPISHSTFAVLHDGVWYEKGQMGWVGYVEDEKSEEEWNACFDTIIHSLDLEDVVALIDCHI